MDQLGKELVTIADSSDTSWSTVPKRMLKWRSFDPRKVNKKGWQGEKGVKGVAKGV